MKRVNLNKNSQHDKVAQFEKLTGIAGGLVAFIAPSLAWLGYTSIPALIKEVTPIEQLTYIEVWLPILALGIAAVILGYGLAHRRNRICSLAAVAIYVVTILSLWLWLFVLHPPLEWSL